MNILNVILVMLLIAATAFFVVAEFAIVKIRGTKIDQLVATGDVRAIAAKRVVSNLDEYLSACQLGITITALGLGWLGESTFEKIIHPVFAYVGMPESVLRIASVVTAFVVITFLHVVMGELAPKTVAIQKAEAVSLWTARPLIIFYKIMFPFIKLLNGSASALAKLFGFHSVKEHEVVISEEELRIMLSESYKKGEINQSEYKYVTKIFEFDNRLAREIMVPRTEIAVISSDQSMKEAIETVMNERYTRYPVIKDDKDHIIGIINSKDLFKSYFLDQTIDLSELMRPVIRVIESIPIQELLIRMQKERIHMAILVDEYGGTAGLVTVEDILEEIVGEIRDEFDQDEMPHIVKKGEHHYIMDGKALIDEVNDLLHIAIENEEVDTIGGWLLTQKMELKNGDIFRSEGCEFKILDAEDHHIRFVEIKKTDF
ncbi:hemolysin family protein [Bacillus sp. FSL M8-0052]|uniref:HlyC/CorC family transporter n=2 Tax=Bacillaceae TaxID=186817 RepID=A0AAJ3Z0Q2_9BACI|nr:MULTISPECIES: hemolysin family protein [Bacillus]KKB74634.1 membrane protein [Bacillus sp. TH008]MBU8788567.1 hemolysin family protein [Bacillus glycinifermentans]MDU0073388.1 hemolysin family protein [Bacillus sp. IG6]MED8021256.1 hemolysin family protein [Bacillus glycinifermentans]NUJ18672.1 HlyC/CorC family transporter [Bacillus glycinifermentans]